GVPAELDDGAGWDAFVRTAAHRHVACAGELLRDADVEPQPVGRRDGRGGRAGLAAVEILGEQSAQDAVDPAVVAAVGAAPDPLAHEADPLGVGGGAVVEAVDLELEAVV